jgi:hypothetical protein
VDGWIPLVEGGGDVLRYRVALSSVAFGLALWLILSADKPWEFALVQAVDWNLGKIVGFYSFWAGALRILCSWAC